MKPYPIQVHISADFACVTRPEMKVVRFSPGVITPLAQFPKHETRQPSFG